METTVLVEQKLLTTQFCLLFTVGGITGIVEQLKKYSCQKCDSKFALASELKIHGKTHKPNEPLSCVTCHKSFLTTRSLREHERTHTEEKPFKCQHCEANFSEAINLKDHEKSHLKLDEDNSNARTVTKSSEKNFQIMAWNIKRGLLTKAQEIYSTMHTMGL